VRPQIITPVPFNYPRPTNPLPIVLAAVVGLTITLYRNDLLHAGARTVGQEGNYLRLEAALGGPGFGTPRAVEPMAKAAAALADLPPAPLPTSTSRSHSSTSSSQSDSSSSTTTTTAATAKATSTSKPEPPKPAAAAPAPRPVQPAAVSRPAPGPEEAPNAVFKQPKGAKRAKGNEFDPLNPNL
jgi:hypothetical protein